MSSKTTYTCDWCKETKTEADLPLESEGWVRHIDVELAFREQRSRGGPPSVYVFPKDMRDEALSNDSPDLCGDCVAALQEAVADTRRVRLDKGKRRA